MIQKDVEFAFGTIPLVICFPYVFLIRRFSFPGEVIKGDSIFVINVTSKQILSSALLTRGACGPGRETQPFHFHRATSRWPSSASRQHPADTNSCHRSRGSPGTGAVASGIAAQSSTRSTEHAHTPQHPRASQDSDTCDQQVPGDPPQSPPRARPASLGKAPPSRSPS